MKINYFKNFCASFGRALTLYFKKLTLFRIAQCFFYLFFAFLPFQIDALVVTGEIYFSGFFNPYLSHFVYLSDVFLILALVGLALSLLFEKRKKFKFTFGNHWISLGVLLFFGSYLISIIFAYDPLNSLIYSARLLEFIVVCFLISSRFIDLKKLFYVFIGVISFVAFIGIFQYVLQESLGLRFLGEPIVSSRALGVAKIGLFDEKILRIYGTFPHPNIFAGYLVFAIFMIIYCLKEAREMVKVLFSLLLVVCLLALLLTFSRSAFLALFAGLLLYYTVSDVKISLKYVVLALVLIFFFVVAFDLSSVLGWRILIGDESGTTERMFFLSASKEMFLDNIFGVGAGNFTLAMQDYLNVKLMPWLFQPVHNIYLLVFNELGIQGGLIFLGFFGYIFAVLTRCRSRVSCYSRLDRGSLSFPRLLRRGGGKRESILPILMSLWAVIFVIGLFDHYFISLYQGQVLFWMFVGVSNAD